MNWYDYDTNNSANISAEATLAEELLHASISNKVTTSISGIARSFTLTKKSKINFSVLLSAISEDFIPDYSIFIVQNKNILKQYDAIFSDSTGYIRSEIIVELEAGEYEIVVGGVKAYNLKIKYDILDFDYIIPKKNKPSHFMSMWCWSNNSIYKDTESVLLMSKKLSIDCIYQGDMKDVNLNNDAQFKTYLELLHKNKISLYFAVGGANDYNNIENLKKQIDNVVDYNNKNLTDKIDGVIFDVEPYTASIDPEVSKNEKLIIWRKNAKILYLYANSKSLKIIFCIPSWYNNSLIYSFNHYSDGLSIMNYNVEKAMIGLDEEIEEAKKNSDWIENITEFQKPREGLPIENTVYNLGINYAQRIWEKQKEKYQYPLLAFSYHYFIPLLDLIKSFNINAPLIPIRTIAKKINNIPIKSGQLIITIDTHEIYSDINERERILLGDFLAKKDVKFSLTLVQNKWEKNTQVINNLKLKKDGYTYLISPISIDYEAYCDSFIYADEIIADNKIVFHCKELPEKDLQVSVIGMEVQ